MIVLVVDASKVGIVGEDDEVVVGRPLQVGVVSGAWLVVFVDPRDEVSLGPEFDDEDPIDVFVGQKRQRQPDVTSGGSIASSRASSIASRWRSRTRAISSGCS